MEYPDGRSQLSSVSRQRRGPHSKSVDSGSHGYVNDFGRDHVSSWLRSVDDQHSRGSSSTEILHHEPSGHSAKKHRKAKSRDNRSPAPEDMTDESGYDEQRNRRNKLRSGRGSLAEDPGRSTARLGRGSLAKDPDHPTARLDRGSPEEDPYRPTAHREHFRRRPRELKYDSDDSFTWAPSNKRKSNKHETNAGSYAGSGDYRKRRGEGIRQQNYGDSFEIARGSRYHQEIRPRLGSSHLDAFDRLHNDYDRLDYGYEISDYEYGRLDDDRYSRPSSFSRRGHRVRDEDDYVPLRRIQGSDRHQRLLGPPSDKGGRHGSH